MVSLGAVRPPTPHLPSDATDLRKVHTMFGGVDRYTYWALAHVASEFPHLFLCLRRRQ